MRLSGSWNLHLSHKLAEALMECCAGYPQSHPPGPSLLLAAFVSDPWNSHVRAHPSVQPPAQASHPHRAQPLARKEGSVYWPGVRGCSGEWTSSSPGDLRNADYPLSPRGRQPSCLVASVASWEAAVGSCVTGSPPQKGSRSLKEFPRIPGLRNVPRASVCHPLRESRRDGSPLAAARKQAPQRLRRRIAGSDPRTRGRRAAARRGRGPRWGLWLCHWEEERAWESQGAARRHPILAPLSPLGSASPAHSPQPFFHVALRSGFLWNLDLPPTLETP